MASTYCALAILKTVGFNLWTIDKESILISLRNLQQPDGRYALMYFSQILWQKICFWCFIVISINWLFLLKSIYAYCLQRQSVFLDNFIVHDQSIGTERKTCHLNQFVVSSSFRISMWWILYTDAWNWFFFFFKSFSFMPVDVGAETDLRFVYCAGKNWKHYPVTIWYISFQILHNEILV